MKDQLGFDHCSLVSGVDRCDRMQVVYHISSFSNNITAEIVVDIPRDNPEIDAITPLWEGANWHERETYDMGGENTTLLQFDVFAALFALVFLSVALYVVLTSARYVEKDRHQAEYFSLIMLATSGMMLVAMATDLITLYVGLEVTSISSFALVAFRKKDKRGAEASVKYLVIGGMSSALSLYGISLLFGIAGTTNLAGLNTALAAMPATPSGSARASMPRPPRAASCCAPAALICPMA